MGKKNAAAIASLVDRNDGYMPPEHGRWDDAEHLDAFKNEITGLGDFTRDKVYGGKENGPDFVLRLMTGPEAEARWRGSDLGHRIIETIPDEMVREGWTITIQPSDDDKEPVRGDARRRGDDFPFQQQGAALGMPPLPPEPTMELPEVDDESQQIIEELDGKLEELNASTELWQALCYRRAYGGAGILLGVDDGGGPRRDFRCLSRRADGSVQRIDLDAYDPRNLTQPLNEENIKTVSHLTTFRGGWDGELTAWSYYNDPTMPKYGEPEIYLMRNLGVPIAKIPVPGTVLKPTDLGPFSQSGRPGMGPYWFWVHESRLLLFPGQPSSRWARVQMRGWGDSVFTRVNEVLMQYGQTWQGVANLMQDFAQGVLSMSGLAEMFAANNPQRGKGNEKVAQRARMINMFRSICNVMLVDANEKFDRITTPLTGIADILREFALRLAAAADMPVELLMGQTQSGGLNKGDTTYRFFADRIAARQKKELYQPVRKLIRVLMLAKDGPTGGVEPERWNVEFKALSQLTEQEEAQLRKTVAETDHIYIQDQVLEPAEVAVAAFAGSKWKMDRTIDFAGRAKMAQADKKRQAEIAKTQAAAAKEQRSAKPPQPDTPPPKTKE
jgi:phage-related protein (TIGR01555 family)